MHWLLLVRLAIHLAPDSQQGPQISQRQFDRVMNYIEAGKKEGATCYYGGNRVGDTGYFIEPTIFTGTCCICHLS